MNPRSRLLIHPCYQIALNLTKSELPSELAQEIYDDYEIEITSISQEQRNKKVGQLITRLRSIESGREDSAEFEEWCLEAVRMAFAGSLRNIEFHPNKDAPQRRDIVAHNPAADEFWRQVLSDYGTRQVIFEVKNYADLEPDDFRQMSSYLVDAYGRIGFVITRSDNKEPGKDKDLKWIREIYWKDNKKLVVPLSYKWLVGFLEKIRNPQKHDAVNKALSKLIDTYHRVYLNESAKK